MIDIDDVFQVRRSIGNPVAGDFTLVAELPETGLLNTAYTTGNGEYWFYDQEWQKYPLKFGDAFIKLLVKQHGRIKASIKLIDNLIAQLDPLDYINSGNAGGQSMSFPSLNEVLEYYNALRNHLLEEEAAEAGMNSGLMLQTKRRAVGGVLEDYE